MPLTPKAQIVTRFIGYKKHFDRIQGIVRAAAFITPKNIEKGEISVYRIDTELKNKDEEKIFSIGDKLYKNPPTPARADLKVSEIEKIKTENTNLFVKTKWYTQHCNIKPFPNDEIKALKTAMDLARISTLHLRK